jgi:hypothetical protein
MSRYSAYILGLSPIAYLRLGEPSGTLAIDQLYGHHGFYHGASPGLGAPSLVPSDPTDTAFAGDYASAIALETALPALAEWSFAFWIKGAAASDFSGVVNQPGDHFDIALQADQSIFYFDGAWHDSGIDIAIGATALLVFTFDATNGLTIYRDGIQALADPARGRAIASVTWWLAGWSPDAHDASGSTFDEWAIWDRALTADEVERMFAVSAAVPSLQDARAELISALEDAGLAATDAPGAKPIPYVLVAGDGIDTTRIVAGKAAATFRCVCIAGAWDESQAVELLDGLKLDVLSIIRGLPGYQVGPVGRDGIRSFQGADVLTADVATTVLIDV